MSTKLPKFAFVLIASIITNVSPNANGFPKLDVLPDAPIPGSSTLLVGPPRGLVAKVKNYIPDSATCYCTGCPDDSPSQVGILGRITTNNQGSYLTCRIPEFDSNGYEVTAELCTKFVVVPF